MSSIYPENWSGFAGIGVIFLRLLGLFLFVPLLSHKTIPPLFKIILALVFSLALHPILKDNLPVIPASLGGFISVVLRESVVGFLMGFVAHLTFEGIHLAAQIVGSQMGLGTAGLIDPNSQTSSSVLVALQSWLALLVFLLADLHHDFLLLFVRSFELTRFDAPLEGASLFPVLVGVSSKVFSVAVQLAAPYSVVLLGCNIVIGVLSRMLPQMNVIMFSFPITIGLGLVCLFWFIPELIESMEIVVGDAVTDVAQLLRTI